MSLNKEPPLRTQFTETTMHVWLGLSRLETGLFELQGPEQGLWSGGRQ